ncbi:unnamed protein product [Phytophthora fragariaefolia]|uniref:Unnamed protein product n=1 Tax=Phytophthora fragariaefolia TaxID=1490495 RepID=A0A9W7CM02_9STRA|nr:unnamed protein product [Phytophthora fragariaefolia]
MGSVLGGLVTEPVLGSGGRPSWLARKVSLKWSVTEVEGVRNVPSHFDYADRFWEHPSWTAPVSRSPSLRSAGAIVAPAFVLAFRPQCTSPHNAATENAVKMLYHLICSPEMSIVIPKNQISVNTSGTESISAYELKSWVQDKLVASAEIIEAVA